MLLDVKMSLNSQLWNKIYCSSFREHRLLKAKHSGKKKREEGASALWREALTVMDCS